VTPHEVKSTASAAEARSAARSTRLASRSIRRVVTGVNAEGTSVFVSDESVAAVAPAFMPGMELHRL